MPLKRKCKYCREWIYYPKKFQRVCKICADEHRHRVCKADYLDFSDES